MRGMSPHTAPTWIAVKGSRRRALGGMVTRAHTALRNALALVWTSLNNEKLINSRYTLILCQTKQDDLSCIFSNVINPQAQEETMTCFSEMLGPASEVRGISEELLPFHQLKTYKQCLFTSDAGRKSWFRMKKHSRSSWRLWFNLGKEMRYIFLTALKHGR